MSDKERGRSDDAAEKEPAAPLTERELEAAERPFESFVGFYDELDEEGKKAAEKGSAAAAPDHRAPARPQRSHLKIGIAGAAHVAPKKRSAKQTATSEKDAEPQPRPQSASSKAAAPKARPASVAEEDEGDKAKARKGAVFMAVILGVYFAWILITGQMGDFVGALANASVPWLVGALACMAFNTLCGTLAFVFAVYIDPSSPVGVRDCLSVEASGVLFGNLTPMSSGTVPAQIYRLTRAGLEVGEATALQLTRFVMYQAGEVVVAAVLLLLKFQFFVDTYGNIVFLNLVVFAIQTAQASGLLIVCLLPRFVIRVGNWGIKFAWRHNWIGDATYDKYYQMVNEQVMQFSDAFRASFEHKWSLALTWLATLGQMVGFYSVPWFVLNALGMQADFLTCLAAASMVQMIGNSVPLPGGTGGNEAGFAFFFGPIFGAMATPGFVIWRLASFFIPTLVALPLSALRSNHHRSIYQRWNTFVHRRGMHATVSVGRPAQKGQRLKRGAGVSLLVGDRRDSMEGRTVRRGRKKETVFKSRRKDR